MTVRKNDGFLIAGTGPGLSARIQLALLRLMALIDRLSGGRGLGLLVPLLGKAFRTDNHLLGVLRGRPLKVRMMDAYWITPLMRTGVYEPEVGGVLHRVLREDSAFIDCGANIGYWSVLATGLIGLPGRVVAAEASPYTAALLQENRRLNDDAFVAVEYAVWSTSGQTIDLAVDEHRHSWSSGEPHVIEDLKRMGFSSTQVPTITIDDLHGRFVDQDATVIVVKIDVEGSEESAIRGATETLKRDAVFIYEEHGRSGHADATGLLMNEMGMQVFTSSPSGALTQVRTPQDTKKWMSDPSHGYNFFAVRAGTESYRRLTAGPGDLLEG